MRIPDDRYMELTKAINKIKTELKYLEEELDDITPADMTGAGDWDDNDR